MRLIGVSTTLLVLAAGAAAQPKAVLEREQVDLGVIGQDATARASITVRNEGNAPLEILGAQSSCPCVTIDADFEEPFRIAPGGSGELPITYTPEDRYGPAGAKVALRTNDPEMPALIASVAVVVKALVLVKPPRGITWSMAPRGEPLSKTLTLESGEPSEALSIITAAVDSPHIEAIEERVNPREVRYRFRLNESHPLGEAQAVFRASAEVGGERQTIEVPLRGGVIGDALIYPPSIVSPATAYAPGDRISAITVRSSRGGPAPEVLGAMVEGPLRAVVRTDAGPGSHQVEVYAAKGGAAGPGGGQVHVMTSSEDTPIVSVPVFFRLENGLSAEPPRLTLQEGATEPQRVAISAASGGAIRLEGLGYEDDLLEIGVANAASQEPEAALTFNVRAKQGVPDERRATMLVIKAQAGEVRVPILIRP